MPIVWDQISEIWTGSANWTPEVSILRPSSIRVSTSLLKSSPSVACRGETWPSFGVWVDMIRSSILIFQTTHSSVPCLLTRDGLRLQLYAEHISEVSCEVYHGIELKEVGWAGHLWASIDVSKKSKRKSSDWFAFISCYKQAHLFLIFPDVYFPISHTVEFKGTVQWYTGSIPSFTVSSSPNQSGYDLKLSIWEQLR